MVEIWVSQPLNPSSYAIFHSLKWVMTDHLCITKMREYLQWIHSFLYKWVKSGRQHSFFFFFFARVLWPLWTICKPFYAIPNLLYYNKIIWNQKEDLYGLVAISPQPCASQLMYIYYSTILFRDLKKKLTPLATTAPIQLQSALQTSFNTWDLKVTFQMKR